MGESTAHKDFTINHSEEISWVAQGEIASPRVDFGNRFLPLQEQKANEEPLSSSQQQSQRCAQREENPLIFPVNYNRLKLLSVCRVAAFLW